jgi:hypothetical protein
MPTYNITLTNYRPAPRYPPVTDPWTTARIEEAATADGPWTAIDTITLDPVDTDPTSPQARNLTTELATLTNGWYRVIFADATGDEDIPGLAVRRGPTLRPTLADVGAILRARTTVMGTEVGTFDETTRPKAGEVDELIDMSVAELALLLPDEVPDRYLPFAQRLVALRTAMAIEISYDPDRLEADSTAYDRLKDMYDSGLRALLDGLADRDQGVTRRIASMPVVSPTLAPYPDELREIMAPDPWPFP